MPEAQADAPQGPTVVQGVLQQKPPRQLPVVQSVSARQGPPAVTAPPDEFPPEEVVPEEPVPDELLPAEEVEVEELPLEVPPVPIPVLPPVEPVVAELLVAAVEDGTLPVLEP